MVRDISIELQGFNSGSLEELTLALKEAFSRTLGDVALSLIADGNVCNPKLVIVRGVDTEAQKDQGACDILNNVFSKAEIYFVDSEVTRIPRPTKQGGVQ